MNNSSIFGKSMTVGDFIPVPPATSQKAEFSQENVAADLPEIISGSNPLVTSANPILNLVPQLRLTAQHPNPATLRDYLIEEIKTFELRAKQAGVNNETIIGARYCLCTVLDETAAQTPWGGSGSWSHHSLLVTFHNETSGGEKFFQLLSKLAQNPQQHKELLELMYYCLAMGFEGRFRVIDNGRAELEALKQRLLHILDSTNGELEKALSCHWKGEEARKKKDAMYLPVWAVACMAGIICTFIYIWVAFGLAKSSDDLFAAINSLRVPHVVIEAADPPKPAPPRLTKFLENEIREGLVSVRDEADRSIVTLLGDGLFESASATLRDRYIPVISRISDAINMVPGNVQVAGYTDNISIRTLQFPSNWHLSQARADSVKTMLVSRLSSGSRVTAIGRGAEDPIAANDTPSNRAKNRRVEITIMLAADTRDR